MLTPLTSTEAQATTSDPEIGLRDFLVTLGEVGKAVIAEAVAEDSGRSDFFPEQVEEDENGKLRRLHEYFGEYSWSRDPLVATLPDNVMVYWYHQLQRFTYNHHKIRVDDRTWQTVPYTWRHQRGVCRDSATLLADMLCYHGYDARLVLGDWPIEPGFRPDPDSGHAWVVVRDPSDGNEYLLESTEEMWDYSKRFPPRTFNHPEYLPVMQVNPHAYFTSESIVHTPNYTDGWTIKPAS